MSKLNFTQRIARIVGKKAGRNTWFSPDITDPDNQSVYTSIEPMRVSQSLGTVRASDLPAIIKARVQSYFTKRAI